MPDEYTFKHLVDCCGVHQLLYKGIHGDTRLHKQYVKANYLSIFDMYSIMYSN